MNRLSAPSQTLLALSGGAAALLALAGCATGTTETPTSTDSTSESPAAGSSAEYADGTYSGHGTYLTPGGESGVNVTVTLADNTVTAVEVVSDTSIPDSLQFQSQFISGIQAEVVGKSLDEISVSRVAGSSLTSQGFMAALAEIKADAEA